MMSLGAVHPESLPVKWTPMSLDRKSTRLNFSHVRISYAVFCLKKKKVYQKQAESRLIETSDLHDVAVPTRSPHVCFGCGLRHKARGLGHAHSPTPHLMCCPADA